MGLVLMVAASAAASDAAPAVRPDLQVKTHVIHQRFCAGSPDETLGMLQLTLEIELRNAGEQHLILSRQAAGGDNRVATSLSEAAREHYVGGIASGLIVDDEASLRLVPRVIEGRAPDPRQFLVLRPGEAHLFEITTSVPASLRSAGAVQAFIPVGADYFVNVDVSFWPFRLDGGKADRLTKQWSRIGDLVFATATGLIPVHVPDFPAAEVCAPSSD